MNVTGLSFFILACLGLVIAQATFSSDRSLAIGFLFSTTEPVLVESITNDVSPTDIFFVGDVMLARQVERYMYWYGASYPFSKISFPTTTHYTVVNFEAAIPVEHRETPDLGFAFSVPSTAIASLHQAGVTHAGLANNHSYDYGASDFLHTKQAIASSSVTTFGTPVFEATSSLTYLSLENETVAVLALNAINHQLDYAVIAELLSEAMSVSDQQFIYIHWGTEYAPIHNVSQRAMAKKLIELGADAIIGAHPHVVQDVEYVDGVPVFYSLGNYIFDQYFSEEVQTGLVLEYQASTSQFILHPVSTINSRIAPYYITGNEKRIFFEELAKRSGESVRPYVTAGVVPLRSENLQNP